MKNQGKNHAKFSIGYHIIWCPKYRHPVLSNQIEVELKYILHQSCNNYGWNIESLEVMPDHVHIFVTSTPTISPVSIARTLKSISAIYLFRQFPLLKQWKFWGSGLWGRGTYYATVGHISQDAVRRYIENQKTRV